MLLNLFSSFDPSTSIYLRINWLSIFLPIFIWPRIYWTINSRLCELFNFINQHLCNEFIKNFTKKNIINFIIYLRLFWFIIFNNFLGLFPYIFTASSHLTFSLTLALLNWFIFLTFRWSKKTNKIFYHLVPLGTPLALSIFIVLIETIRNIIRPITLSIRLSANIIAGHLLITLLANISQDSFYIFFLSAPILFLLLLLEIGVAIIQSYVFTTLLSLYFNEI